MQEITIRALTPELEGAYLDFFDHRAFSDGSPYYPCYCSAFNMSASGIGEMRELAAAYGGGTEGWKQAQRETAARMVREGRIRGCLAFAGGIAVGWCNANDRTSYYRVGEFDLDHVPPDRFPDGVRAGQIRSVVCFEISPGYRGQGIASMLLSRVCGDAGAEGYEFVEAYPSEKAQPALAFTGPIALYRKMGFTEFSRSGDTIVMRKRLP
ncbi:MAG: GNAT family N-acetyltransferase [Clostridia bacterium]|nr:GNAT family N-acetyltransferase [Clostridia bacterium]